MSTRTCGQIFGLVVVPVLELGEPDPVGSCERRREWPGIRRPPEGSYGDPRGAAVSHRCLSRPETAVSDSLAGSCAGTGATRQEVRVVDDRLAEVVADGARLALAAIVARRPGEHLTGFALCTDDDLSSLSAAGCTREFLAGHDPAWQFQPTEWPDDVPDPFGEARRMLAGQHDRTETFRSLVAALTRLRREGTVADDVFLVVCGTDPGELLTRLEEAAVRELNSAGVLTRWPADGTG
jgi:hypothetical protein